MVLSVMLLVAVVLIEAAGVRYAAGTAVAESACAEFEIQLPNPRVVKGVTPDCSVLSLSEQNTDSKSLAISWRLLVTALAISRLRPMPATSETDSARSSILGRRRSF